MCVGGGGTGKCIDRVCFVGVLKLYKLHTFGDNESFAIIKQIIDTAKKK